jgi:Uncharacterised nucleotidyltransferase
VSVTAIWEGVDRLIDVAAGPRDLRAHGLHLLAVRRWRSRGRVVPDELVGAERAASFVALAAPLVLAEVRAAYDGAIVVLKGPELAARYPDPALRPYGDLDLLVDDGAAARRAMLGAGFTPAGAMPRDDFHHLQGLQSPRFPLRVEVHTRLGWVDGANPPRLQELLESAQPTAVAVDGVLALTPAHHAVLVAVHAWVHEPLGRISQLVDAALLASECDRRDISVVASRWGVGKLWRTTADAFDALLFDERARRRTIGVPLRKLECVRERTVLESHLYRALAPFWALPPSAALAASAAAFGRAVRPAPGESWSEKAWRAQKAIRHATMRRSQHERTIGFRP